jgi:mono/diheme cytochrome c family protein
MRMLSRLLIAILTLVGLGTVIGAMGFIAGGISARQDPGRLELAVAPKLRSMAIPSALKNRQNPVPDSPKAIAEGLEHFADHCAICHANDGSGDTEMGKNLYPRVPDMRLPATQSLSDGEIAYIIENGVRLTGMPAWGSEHGEESNWNLVRFIRHLPRLTEAELQHMKALNPKGPDERKDDEDARKFLDGDDAHKPAAPPHKHGGKG